MKTIRNVVLLFVVFVTFALSAFAEYKPIPKHLSKQYKADMERIIDEEYPKIINKIDIDMKQATNYYNRILKYGYYSDNQTNVYNLYFMYEIVIPNSDIHLYNKLFNITCKKYLKMNNQTIATDYSGTFANFLEPYFNDNKVNIKKLIDIIDYEKKQNEIVKKYIKQAEKLRPIE